jgi:hypothetical protein
LKPLETFGAHLHICRESNFELSLERHGETLTAHSFLDFHQKDKLALIKWAGFPDDYATWESLASLEDDAFEEWHQVYLRSQNPGVVFNIGDGNLMTFLFGTGTGTTLVIGCVIAIAAASTVLLLNAIVNLVFRVDFSRKKHCPELAEVDFGTQTISREIDTVANDVDVAKLRCRTGKDIAAPVPYYSIDSHWVETMDRFI